MKVYLSGPISGVPDYREHFAAAADWVRQTGNEPVNPAENDIEEERASFALLVGLYQLHECEAIALLPGWENSRGANIERLFAEYMGILVITIPTGEKEEAEGTPCTFGFGHALEWLKEGFSVRRRGWNGRGIFITMQKPGPLSKMTQPYIFIDSTALESDNPDAAKGLVPWVASQTDMLAEDWEVVV